MKKNKEPIREQGERLSTREKWARATDVTEILGKARVPIDREELAALGRNAKRSRTAAEVNWGLDELLRRGTAVEKDGKGGKKVAHRNGATKAEQGHFKKAGTTSKKYVREFRFENCEDYKPGDEIKADIFAQGDHIDATAITKGKGFQGAIKRLGQHRGPMKHGSKFHRHQGSNGACSSPSRVFKGKGMPGHMGSVKVTVQNLEVVRVDADKNLLLVKGAVPGAKKALVTLKETTRADI